MKKNLGFTLLELMIAVTVIGILAAIGYPSYLDQVRKARRAEAQAVLMNIAARQQQMLLDTRSYAATVGALNISVPDTVQRTYGVSISVGTGTVPSFTATATPSGSQTADSCAAMSINQSGIKSPSTCW